MTPARPVAVILLGLAATAVTWLGLDVWGGLGRREPPLPWTTAVFIAALAGGVIAAGLPVRRWVSGRRTRPLNPLVATRTVVLAKAAAYGGALLAGWYGGQGLVLLPGLVEIRRTRLVIAVVCAVTAILLAGCGLLVQRWCRVPPPDDQDHPDGP
jgi:hypothetical protein